MSNHSHHIVPKLWNYCNVLRDDGMSYGNYVEQLTYFLFLKMADERTKPRYNQPSQIPDKYSWPSILVSCIARIRHSAEPLRSRSPVLTTRCNYRCESSTVFGLFLVAWFVGGAMAVFRRPELEKDNPVAPQMYVGPRRRRALLREASLSPVSKQGAMAEALQALTEAAERFVGNVPPSKKLQEERGALLEAIIQARQLLSGEPLLWREKLQVCWDYLGSQKGDWGPIDLLEQAASNPVATNASRLLIRLSGLWSLRFFWSSGFFGFSGGGSDPTNEANVKV
jgi:HsdM N-terminal domain